MDGIVFNCLILYMACRQNDSVHGGVHHTCAYQSWIQIWRGVGDVEQEQQYKSVTLEQCNAAEGSQRIKYKTAITTVNISWGWSIFHALPY